jgi:hypothetical protein
MCNARGRGDTGLMEITNAPHGRAARSSDPRQAHTVMTSNPKEATMTAQLESLLAQEARRGHTASS